MTRLLWTILRFCLSAWVGAAALFVVTGIREVTSTEFDAITKNHLALLRFPAYYAAGFGLMSLATVASLGLVVRHCPPARRIRVIAALCLTAVIVMVADRLWVYAPLETMMLDEAARVNPDFRTYHQWSKWINLLSVGMSLAAAVLAAVPRRQATVDTIS